ncbi:hypothetical protein BDQ17DRAFT_1335050 [Cyathus striatus]|nr:hypothetical protein BDQ17DRAFT_1335050 [Cyathus striatus]
MLLVRIGLGLELVLGVRLKTIDYRRRVHRKSAVEVTEKEEGELIAFGRHFLANPDLPRRLEENLPLNKRQDEVSYSAELPEPEKGRKTRSPVGPIESVTWIELLDATWEVVRYPLLYKAGPRHRDDRQMR